MVRITSAFANPSDAEIRDERNKDIVIGKRVRISFCRVRKGWIALGGALITDHDKAIEYASKVMLFLRDVKV